LKYLGILFTSLGNLARMGGEREGTKVGFAISLPLMLV